jgi:hypothetical protein
MVGIVTGRRTLGARLMVNLNSKFEESSSSSSSSSVHWDSVTAKRPMELICSVSLIVKTIGILEDEDDDEDDSKSRDLG